MQIKKNNSRNCMRNIILSLIMFVSSMASAQGVADVWMNKTIEKLQNKGSEISFRIDEDGMRLSGKLLMDDNKFFYDAGTIKIWFDGTTQWTLQTDAGYSELYINEPNLEDLQIINPYLLLKHYKDFFTISDGGEKSINGKLAHMVKLNAIDNSVVSSVNVYIANDNTPIAVELVLPDGMVYEIEMRSMRNGLTFPKNTFTYPEKEYPANEVIDMR